MVGPRTTACTRIAYSATRFQRPVMQALGFKMNKRGINSKAPLIQQINAPTKSIHLKLLSFSKWFLGAQLLGAVLNVFSMKIIIICLFAFMLTIISIMASKHPSNNYVRQLVGHNKISKSEAVESVSTLISAILLLYAFYLYIEKLALSAQ